MVFGDRGFRGCDGVIVCDSKDMEGKREGMVGKEEKEDSSERQWEGSGV